MSPVDAAYQWDLFWMLTRTEFRMRDQGTIMGFLWTLVAPLSQFFILYMLFTQWMGPLVDDYGAYLLIGIVQWNFFASGTTHGLTCLRRKSCLIGNFSFSRIFVVLSSVFAVLLSHLLEWLLLLVVLAVLGVSPTVWWLLLPLVILLELALIVGFSCLLSILAVDLRDLDHAWGILLYALFFLTPIFYTVEIVGDAGRLLLAWNPLACLIEFTRGLLIGGTAALPSTGLPVLGMAFLIAVGGVALFFRLSRRIPERL